MMGKKEAAVICAMERELEPILKRASDIGTEIISKYTFYTCTIEGVQMVVVCCGTNKVNAAVAANII